MKIQFISGVFFLFLQCLVVCLNVVDVAAETKVISVSSGAAFNSTGVVLEQGDTAEITMTGTISYGSLNHACQIPIPPTGCPAESGGVVPSAHSGEVIGRLDSGAGFIVGGHLIVNGPGALQLGVNDGPSDYGDNHGAFTATIETNAKKTVFGRVQSREENGVPGININLTGTTKNGDPVSLSTSTDKLGNYSIDVDRGTYTVEATGEGDYDDLGATKKENGGELSAETVDKAVCAGKGAKNICTLDPIEDNNAQANFVYTVCAKSDRIFNGKPQTHCPIVFVPGFLGTRIACDGGATELWPGLPLPKWGSMYLQADGETNATDNNSCNTSANNVPGRDGLIDTVAGVDIYQSAITFFDNEVPGRWWASPYDWRKSAVSGATKLGLVVNTALETTHSKFVVLYGHSMGGLVIREFINDSTSADKVVRIVTAGTPYWGAPKAHFSLLGGYIDTPEGTALDHVSWKTELQHLSRNLQGAFFLYPSTKFGPWLALARQQFDSFRVQTQNGEEDWVESLGGNLELLRNARAWHARNDGFPETPIPYQVVVGSGTATAIENRIRVPLGQVPYGNIVLGNGDGTVPLRSATQGGSETGVPDGKAVPLHYVCGVGHVDLPGNSEVLKNIRSYLLAGEDVTELDNKCPYSGAMILVSEIVLGGGNIDIRVTNNLPKFPLHVGPETEEAVRKASAPMTLDEASDLELVQTFPVGNTTAILTDDAHPVTITATGKNLALQMQKVSSTKTGPLESYRADKGSIVMDPTNSKVLANNKTLKKITIVKKAPTTTARLSKKGAQWVVTLKAQSPNGVLGTYYRLSKKGKTQVYSRPLKLKSSALSTFNFYTVDPFGQSEKWRSISRKSGLIF